MDGWMERERKKEKEREREREMYVLVPAVNLNMYMYNCTYGHRICMNIYFTYMYATYSYSCIQTHVSVCKK